MNRYLEKVAELEKEALNALKARAMAHEAGVVVDPDTQWKWALRQFRGQRGQLVQGKERSQVLNRLMGNPAAGNNNFRQAIQSEQRKLTPRDEVQLNRGYNPGKPARETVQEQSSIQFGNEGWELYPNRDIGIGSYSVYPPHGRSGFGSTRGVHYEVRTPHPAEPKGLESRDIVSYNSGSTDGSKEPVDVTLNNRRLNTRFDTHVHPLTSEVKRKHPFIIKDSPFDTANYSDSRFRATGGNHRQASPSGLGFRKDSRGRLQRMGLGDLGVYSSSTHIGSPANILSAPGEDKSTFLGLHRVKKGPSEKEVGGLRSAYLDLTPRKARPANPYLDKLQDMGKTL